MEFSSKKACDLLVPRRAAGTQHSSSCQGQGGAGPEHGGHRRAGRQEGDPLEEQCCLPFSPGLGTAEGSGPGAVTCNLNGFALIWETRARVLGVEGKEGQWLTVLGISHSGSIITCMFLRMMSRSPTPGECDLLFIEYSQENKNSRFLVLRPEWDLGLVLGS